MEQPNSGAGPKESPAPPRLIPLREPIVRPVHGDVVDILQPEHPGEGVAADIPARPGGGVCYSSSSSKS